MYFNKFIIQDNSHNIHFPENRLVYVFNPDHDMALANFTRYYKMPGEIYKMSDDLSFLPVWYSLPESVVKVNDPTKLDAFIGQTSHFRKFSESDFTFDFSSNIICPWGWNPSLCHKVNSSAVNGKVYNGFAFAGGRLCEVDLDRIRFLSSRQRCSEILSSVDLIGEAFSAYTVDEAIGISKSLGTDVILKSPWSGSGRGLLKLSSLSLNNNVDSNSLGWISRIIRNQGCIMVEPLYNKVCDFAMEFFSDADGSISFCGYSLFETDSHGNYKQNILMSDDNIESFLTRYISKDLVSYVKNKLLFSLKELINGDYVGYLGVDMMVCKLDDTHCFNIHPCVEINLRMNMGVVSRIFFDRYVAPHSIGKYIVEYFHNDGDAIKHHNELMDSCPLRLNDEGKILNGYLSLTPVVNSTRYQIYVLIS